MPPNAAGGDDFLTKPIAAHELRHKLGNAIELREKMRTLTSQSTDAQRLAFTAMSSMGDLGVVIEFPAQVGHGDQLPGHRHPPDGGHEGLGPARGRRGCAAGTSR